MTLRTCLVHPFVLTALAVALGASARDGVRAQESAASAEAQVTAADAARFRAMISGEVDGLGRLLADNLIYVHSSGKIETKAQFLESLRSGQLKYTSISTLENAIAGSFSGRCRCRAAGI